MWSNENVLQNGLGEVEVMRFKEGMVISLLAMCCCSSILQVYVCTVAISQIRRRASERCMHIFLLNMTVADLLLTGALFSSHL